jgi:hypothetical protein
VAGRTSLVTVAQDRTSSASTGSRAGPRPQLHQRVTLPGASLHRRPSSRAAACSIRTNSGSPFFYQGASSSAGGGAVLGSHPSARAGVSQSLVGCLLSPTPTPTTTALNNPARCSPSHPSPSSSSSSTGSRSTPTPPGSPPRTTSSQPSHAPSAPEIWQQQPLRRTPPPTPILAMTAAAASGGGGGGTASGCPSAPGGPRLRLRRDGLRRCRCPESAPAGTQRRGVGRRRCAALQCFSLLKNVRAGAESLSELPDDVMEMVLCQLPLASLLASRCVCRRWMNITVAPQFSRMRREEGPSRTPWLFLFGVDGNARWGAAPSPAVHALDVAAHLWCRVKADGLNGRFLFSVAGVGDVLYVVGGRSGGSGGGKVKTHKGVLVFTPLTGLVAPGGAHADGPVSASARGVRDVCQLQHPPCSCPACQASVPRHLRCVRGPTPALPRLQLRDILNDDDTDSAALPLSVGQGLEGQPRLGIVAVRGRG